MYQHYDSGLITRNVINELINMKYGKG